MSYTRRSLRQPPRCPRCDSDRIQPISENASATSREGTVVQYLDEYSRCSACQNEFYTKAQSGAHSRALAGALRKAEGLYTPEAIRSVRTKFGLTQAEFERALRTGEKTVVRWERGTVAQSRAADTLIWVADHYPLVFKRLAERNGVRLRSRELPGAVTAAVTVPTDAPLLKGMAGGSRFIEVEAQASDVLCDELCTEQVA
jgi:HTH-type transcriptional regulator / antitoxin MqsA